MPTRRQTLAFAPALIVALRAGQATARPAGLRLIMAERGDCPWCAAWRREVLPGYARSAQGRDAPLLPVPIDGPWPDGLALARAPSDTPTFILVRGGMEVGRFAGYDNPAGFRADLAAVLAAA